MMFRYINRKILTLGDAVIRRRRSVLLLLTLLPLLLIAIARPSVTAYDDVAWLTESHEYTKLKEMGQSEAYVYRVRFRPEQLDRAALGQLAPLFARLAEDKRFTKVHTLFNEPLPLRLSDGENSSYLRFVPLPEHPAADIDAMLVTVPEKLRAYIDADKKALYFYLSSSAPLELGSIESPFAYDVITPTGAEVQMALPLIGAIFILFCVLLWALFKNAVAPLSALLNVSIVVLLSLSLFAFIRPGAVLSLPVLLIVFVIAFANYLYLYYKWHVLQQSLSSEKALKYAMNRTLVPQFFNTFVIVLSASLLVWWSASETLQTMFILLSLALVNSFVVMFFFAPALLSYFSVKESTVRGMSTVLGIVTNFASTLHVARVGLFMLLIGYLLLVPARSMLESASAAEKTTVLSVALSVDAMDMKAVEKLSLMEEALAAQGVEKVASFNSYMREVYSRSNSEGKTMDEANIAGTLYYMHLFDIYDSYVEPKQTLMRVNLPPEIPVLNAVEALQKLPFGEEILFLDADVLIDIAQADAKRTLSVLLLGILLLIALSAALFARDCKSEILRLLVVNAVPVILFYALVEVLALPLSIELFIALLLGVAISSDAELHGFYNRFADGRVDHDDVVADSVENLHLGASNILVHSVIAFVLLAVALLATGTIAAAALYLSVILIFTTISDLYLLPKVLEHKACDATA